MKQYLFFGLAISILLSACGTAHAFVPTAAPTQTSTTYPTNTATNTATNTPTESFTITPIISLFPTNTVSPTFTVTPTLHPFTPGDPTSTPLGEDITDPNFLLGKQAYKDKNYPVVVERMQLALATDPNLAPAYWYRGVAYFNLNECRSGLNDMDKALALDPNYALAWFSDGALNDCLGNKAIANMDYQKALSLDPSLAKVHYNLGADAYQNGDYYTAMEENQLAVSIDPTLVNSWENLAASQLRLGMIDECINSAETAIGLDPNTRLAYYSRGTCQIGLGNYTQALPDLEKYLAKTPADADGWYNLGIAKKFTDDIPGAILAYTKALQLDPKYYEANINRGNIYYDQGEYRKAVDDYTIALKQGDIVLAVQGRANSYYALGDYQHAIPDYEKLYALWPDKLCACGTLAQSYFEVGRYQDAIIAADTAIRLNPANDSLTKLLEIEGRSYYALGNYQNAIDYLTKAEKTLWYTYGFYYRGIAYQATGQKDKAILDLSNFLKWSDPSWTGQAITDSEYLHDLADAKARLKQLQP